ncbi:MAG: polyprenyl synthetase family protein [Microscillaceae bacterium]
MNVSALKAEIEQFIHQHHFGQHPAELYEPIRYLMDLSGKRMRPLLVLLAYQLFAKDWEKALAPAVGLEVFHNFTLMHDDIMDCAPLRRGQATVHEKWNTNIAILSGDVMLVKAYDLMLESTPSRLPQVLRAFNRCAAEVCEGQQLDMNFEQREEVSEAEYIEMIRLKTAVLLGFALELGGLLAGADTKNCQILRDFGENIGIGFQLKDDWLDVYADAEKFGKQVGGDIIANKKTFLLLKALELSKGETKARLMHWLSVKNYDKAQKVREITYIYNQLGVDNLCEQAMNRYFDQSSTLLNQVDAHEDHKAFLAQFANALIQREN